MLEFVSGYFGISLLIVVLIIVVYGGFLLIFRPLVLWYFKIYTIESELQENNELLRGILDELTKKNTQTTYSQQLQQPQQSKEDHSKYMPK